MDTKMHIRRPTELSPTAIAGFKGILKETMHGGTAMRVVFRKKDGTIRTMDVAFDPNLLEAVKGTGKGTEARAATNEARGNLVVRERLADGNFQWRTIGLKKVLSISPCL